KLGEGAPAIDLARGAHGARESLARAHREVAPDVADGLEVVVRAPARDLAVVGDSAGVRVARRDRHELRVRGGIGLTVAGLSPTLDRAVVCEGTRVSAATRHVHPD